MSILYVTCTAPAQEAYYQSTLEIETSDPSQPTLSYPVRCLVDGTPPTIDFSSATPNGDNGWWRTSPVNVRINALDPESGHRVDSTTCSDSIPGGMDPSQVNGPAMTSRFVAEGEHHVSCQAVDHAHNRSLTFETDVRIDTQPPKTTTTVTPPANQDGWHNDDVTVAFECTDAVAGSGIDGPAGGSATRTAETAGTDLTPAGCSDVAGNHTPAATVVVKLDRTPPAFATPTLTPQPNAAGWNRSAVTVHFPCADTGSVQSGVGTSLPDVLVTTEAAGQTVAVEAASCLDRASNAAEQGAQTTVSLDMTDPTTEIVNGPDGVTSSTTATLTYSGADSLSGVNGIECSLDDGAFDPCPADGTSYDALPDGEHSVRVRAMDTAGNIDATPAEVTWVVDTQVPDTTLDAFPDEATGEVDASFGYSGLAGVGGPVNRFECRLDEAPFADCPDGAVEYTGLAPGPHTFAVRAIDAAGNVDPAPATWSWLVDVVAPTTTIAANPPRRTPETTATFEFSAADTGGAGIATVECRLDDAAFAACSSPLTFGSLARGEHTFAVRAADAAGNVAEPPAEWTWSVLDFFVEDDAVDTVEDVPVDIAVADNDVAPAGVEVALHPAPTSSAGGSVEVLGGSLRYVPPHDFVGTDTLTYTASYDGPGGTVTTLDPATVTVHVTPVNDAPTFAPGGVVTVAEDSGPYAAVWAHGVSPGVGESGQSLHFVLDGLSAPSLFATAPAIGADGTLRFTPAPNANGTATVRVRLADGGGSAGGGHDTSAPVTLQIVVQALDDAPRLEVLPSLRAHDDRAVLTVRVSDVDSPDLKLTAEATDAGVEPEVLDSGAIRTVELSGLDFGTRGRLVLRVSDGVRSSTAALRVQVGTAAADTLVGTTGADLLIGRGGDDVLRGRPGDDLIAGSYLDDRLYGGPGDDVLRGGAGHDFLDGGPGTNQLVDDRGRPIG